MCPLVSWMLCPHCLWVSMETPSTVHILHLSIVKHGYQTGACGCGGDVFHSLTIETGFR